MPTAPIHNSAPDGSASIWRVAKNGCGPSPSAGRWPSGGDSIQNAGAARGRSAGRSAGRARQHLVPRDRAADGVQPGEGFSKSLLFVFTASQRTQRDARLPRRAAMQRGFDVRQQQRVGADLEENRVFVRDQPLQRRSEENRLAQIVDPVVRRERGTLDRRGRDRRVDRHGSMCLAQGGRGQHGARAAAGRPAGCARRRPR